MKGLGRNGQIFHHPEAALGWRKGDISRAYEPPTECLLTNSKDSYDRSGMAI